MENEAWLSFKRANKKRRADSDATYGKLESAVRLLLSQCVGGSLSHASKKKTSDTTCESEKSST